MKLGDRVIIRPKRRRSWVIDWFFALRGAHGSIEDNNDITGALLVRLDKPLSEDGRIMGGFWVGSDEADEEGAAWARLRIFVCHEFVPTIDAEQRAYYRNPDADWVWVEEGLSAELGDRGYPEREEYEYAFGICVAELRRLDPLIIAPHWYIHTLRGTGDMEQG
jgi:hypothetical protein